MLVKSLDAFILRSSLLLEAHPDTTRITVSYTHKLPKPSRHRRRFPQESNVVPEHASAVTVVKVKDPESGASFRIVLKRANELSRIWTALGPKGVTLGADTKVRGLAATMAGVEGSTD